ncbi:MAG TPA: MgtC/SapB family protein [Ktedonobacteraceae bacterium]
MISVQTTLLRLSLAVVLGAFVGLERARGERAAGLRTHALVALGACLAMIVSAFGFADILGTRNVTLDPSRIAAQVVSGIGFLGAGTILLRKEMVKGLTTAAAIWVVAAIGLACGAGLFLEAIFTTVLTLGVLTLLQPLRGRIRRSPDVYHLRIKVTAEPSLLSRVYDICMRAGVTMEQIEMQAGNGSDKMEIACATSEAVQLTRSLVALRAAPGMDAISINLRNPTGAMALFPFFSEERSEERLTQ